MKSYPGNVIPQNFDHYVYLQPPNYRPTLIQMRNIILSVIPDAEESISYQIPCFKYLYMLVGVGTNKKFCSFYTMSPALMKEMKAELDGIKVSGSTLHFIPGEPLPANLLVRIVKARMKQNETLASAKKQM